MGGGEGEGKLCCIWLSFSSLFFSFLWGSLRTREAAGGRCEMGDGKWDVGM